MPAGQISSNLNRLPVHTDDDTRLGRIAFSSTGGIDLGVYPPSITPAGYAGQPILATAGTDSACTNGTVYLVELFNLVARRITGVYYQIGSVGGTDKVIGSLYDSAGTLLASTAVAGTTVGTAANIQSVAFDSAIALPAGRFFVGLTFNGTTAKFRTFPVPGSKFIAGTDSQTFGTITTTVTLPTTFTADKGPTCGLY